MRVNITKKVCVPLAPEQCLDFMEQRINKNHAFASAGLLFFFPHRFYRSTDKERLEFAIRPISYGQVFIIRGRVEPEGNQSIVRYRIILHPWFLVLFLAVFMLLFREMFNATLFWSVAFVLALAVFLDVVAQFKVLNDLDGLLASARDDPNP
jgi:hypothetical protein